MITGKATFLTALGCVALLAASGVSQSQDFARAGTHAVNLGVATILPMLLDGNTAVLRVDEASQHQDLNGDGDMVDQVVHVFDATTGELRNFGLSIDVSNEGLPVVGANPLLLQDRLFAFWALEEAADLNGDGDRDDVVLHVYDTERRSLRNLRLAGRRVEEGGLLFDGRRLVFGVDEANQGQRDLDGDGNADGLVLHVFDSITGRVQNTTLGATAVAPRGVVQHERWLVVAVPEGGMDLNGNGKLGDLVAHLFDTANGRITNLKLALGFDPIFFVGDTPFAAGAGVALVDVSESGQAADLNGDQDLNDNVLHVVDLASARIRNTGLAQRFEMPVFDEERGLAAFNVSEFSQGVDLNGDGRIAGDSLHVLSIRTGLIRNLRASLRLISFQTKGRALLAMSEQARAQDLNGDGDQLDDILAFADLASAVPRIVSTGLDISGDATPGDSFPPFFNDVLAQQTSGELTTFLVSEADQGNRDLNGDGDADDFVLHIADASTFTTLNTRLDGSAVYRTIQAPLLPTTGGRVVVPVMESKQGGRDLNRDGDAVDTVLQLLDVRSGQIRNTGVAVATEGTVFPFEIPLAVRGEDFISILVAEDTADLNSDGDTEDRVLHIFDVATQRLTNTGRASGTKVVLPPLFPDFDLEFTGQTDALGFFKDFFLKLNSPVPPIVGPGIGDAYTFIVSEAAQGNVDLNGDGDTDDRIVHATRLTDRDRNGRFDFTE